MERQTDRQKTYRQTERKKEERKKEKQNEKPQDQITFNVSDVNIRKAPNAMNDGVNLADMFQKLVA